MKKFISLLCIFILCMGLVSCKDKNKEPVIEDPVNPIEVSISFSDSENDEIVAEGFEPIAETTFNVEEGATVLEATQLYCISNGLDLTLGSGDTYIKKMLGIGEGDFADTTGWIYTVNGETCMVGANEQVLKEGDKIAWEFVDFSTYAW